MLTSQLWQFAVFDGVSKVDLYTHSVSLPLTDIQPASPTRLSRLHLPWVQSRRRLPRALCLIWPHLSQRLVLHTCNVWIRPRCVSVPQGKCPVHYLNILKWVSAYVVLDSANDPVSKTHTWQTLLLDLYFQLILVPTVIFQHAQSSQKSAYMSLGTSVVETQ